MGPLGTANANTAWQSTTAAAPTVGTTSITFARVGGLGGSQFAVAGGTADALTATFGILPALVDGLQFSVRATSANATATPTFNPNSLGALTICKLGGAALRAGDIAGAGHELILRYRASPARYELLNPKGLASVVPGSNVTVDATDPFNPVVASTAAGIGLKGRLAAYANLPSSGNTAGDAYVLDSDSLIYVWNGTAWPSSGSGIRVSTSTDTPPKIADFATVVGSGCTLTDKIARLDVLLPNTVFMHALYKTCPAPPYTVDAHVLLNVPSVAGSDAVVAGLALTDGTKVRGYYMGFWGPSGATDKLSIDSWTNATTFGAQVSFQTLFKQFVCADHYVRITDDGATRRFWISADGKRYFQVYSEATNTYVTPVRCGLFFHNVNTTGTTAAKVSVLHFKITDSVLGDAP